MQIVVDEGSCRSGENDGDLIVLHQLLVVINPPNIYVIF